MPRRSPEAKPPRAARPLRARQASSARTVPPANRISCPQGCCRGGRFWDAYVQVVYGYDRTHENLPDEYHAEISELGLQFVFDENQMLRTLFMTPVEITTFNPFEDDERVRGFASKAEARQYAKENDVPTSEGEADLMGEHRDWIRFEGVTHSVHYEFVDSAPKRITLQTTNA